MPAARVEPVRRRPDRLPRRDARAGVARIRSRDARPGAAGPRRGRDRLPRLGARQLHGARLRPPRHRARHHATAPGTRWPPASVVRSTSSAGASPAAGAPSASATGCSPSRRACARRSSTTATPTGTAPACSSSSTASSGAAAGSPSRSPTGAGASPPRCRRSPGAASPTPPPTSTSSSTRRSRSGRTRSTPSPSGARGSSWRSTAAPTPTRRGWCDILRRVVAATGKIFGGFPFRRYLFIVHALPVGSGGLEHRASVTMDIAGLVVRGRDRLPPLRRPGGARVLPRLERQAHPRRRARARSTTRARTTRACCGCTRGSPTTWRTSSSCAPASPASGSFEDDRRGLAEVREPPRPQRDAAGRAVVRGVDQAVQAGRELTNRAVSYYEKGLWDGMALDLELRLASGGARGLPELFRLLWDDFGRAERPSPTPTCAPPPRAIAGRSMDRFFERYVTAPTSCRCPRSGARRARRRRPRRVGRERPRAAERDPVRSGRARAWTGLALQPDRTTMRNVVPDSPAWRAGLTFSDEIVAVDGARVTPPPSPSASPIARPARAAARLLPPRRAARGEAHPRREPRAQADRHLDPDAGARAKAVRDGWLGLKG